MQIDSAGSTQSAPTPVQAPAPVAVTANIDSKHKPTPTGDEPKPAASASVSMTDVKAPAAAKPKAHDPNEWRISISLNKFESAVRDIGVGSNNSLVVAEERGRVSVWARQGRSKDFYNKDLFFDKVSRSCVVCRVSCVMCRVSCVVSQSPDYMMWCCVVCLPLHSDARRFGILC